MARALNNITTTNNYSQANTLEAGPAIACEVDVYNNAAYVEFLQSAQGEAGLAVWGPPIYLAPQHRTFWMRGIFGVRAKSAVEGKEAQVTFVLLAEQETTLGYLIDAVGELRRVRESVEKLHGHLDHLALLQPDPRGTSGP